MHIFLGGDPDDCDKNAMRHIDPRINLTFHVHVVPSFGSMDAGEKEVK